MVKTLEYTHLRFDEECTCLVGYYAPQKEVRLNYNEREVLYVVGQAVIEAACCSAPGSWAYVLVPGYVVNWQKITNEAGLPVSDVEPVSDKAAEADIKRIIREAESIPQVDFW